MGLSQIPSRGTWSAYGTTTQSANTAITMFCPPYPGEMAPVGAPFVYALDSSGTPNWWNKNSALTKISLFQYVTGSTAHKIKLMRPLNFTTVASVAAVNQAVINIKADPGIYSTNYKYKQNQKTAAVADHGIAANDWCVYQLVDGTWIFDTVASVATLAITMTTNIPNVAGGGVAAGAPFFYFGVSTLQDPATGYAPPLQYTIVSAFTTIQDDNGFWSALHYGDPLLVQSDNGTAAGFVTALSGYYGQY